MKSQTKKHLSRIICEYKSVVGIMEHNAEKSMREEGRAYGGFIRSAKGKIQEYITDELIKTTWINELGQNPERLEVNSRKVRIPINSDYVESIKELRIKKYIQEYIKTFYYGLSVDKHVFVDKKFVIGIECKAYTENAMIKRILVDFMLLKTRFPNLKSYLFQLESQLGGDYHKVVRDFYGSNKTRTIMSYFKEVDLEIITLLPGERRVDEPINKPNFFKELPIERLEFAVDSLVKGFVDLGVL